MCKRLIALLLAAVAACGLAACTERDYGPPIDFTGEWRQPSNGEWYHIGTITDDTIEVWWYLPAEDLRELYWSGTFTAPETGKEPYSWESVNYYAPENLDSREFYRTSREATKIFTYEDGRISYIVTAGHLQMTFALEKEE